MRHLVRLAVFGATVAAVTAFSAAPSFAAPKTKTKAVSVSFTADPTSSAGWNTGHASIYLTIGSGTSASVYAAAVLHHVSTALPSTSPSFATDTYNAGSPRFDIFLSSGAYLFGYPPNSQVQNATMVWSVNGCTGVNPNAYVPYATAGDALTTSGCSGSVTGVMVIADGDQAAGTTDTISALQYGGTPVKK